MFGVLFCISNYILVTFLIVSYASNVVVKKLTTFTKLNYSLSYYKRSPAEAADRRIKALTTAHLKTVKMKQSSDIFHNDEDRHNALKLFLEFDNKNEETGANGFVLESTLNIDHNRGKGLQKLYID